MRPVDGIALAIMLLGGAAIANTLCSVPRSAGASEKIAFMDKTMDTTEAPTALYVYDLNKAAIEMPREMALGAGTVWLGCEIKARAQTPYADLAAALGAAGERGQGQIHPSWERNPAAAIDFARLGLHYSDEGDRIRFAVILWERLGWPQWSCSKTMGVK